MPYTKVLSNNLFIYIDFYLAAVIKSLDQFLFFIKTIILQQLTCFIFRFASPQVVKQFSLLVETYATNSKLTNMAVFTMLCHICVECKKMESLYNPTLLRALGEHLSVYNCLEMFAILKINILWNFLMLYVCLRLRTRAVPLTTCPTFGVVRSRNQKS